MNQTPAGKTTAELFQRDFLSDDKHHLNKYWKNHWERKYDKDEKKPTGRKKFGSERSVNKEQFDFQKSIVKSPPSGSSSATVSSDTAFNNLKQQSGAMSKWNFTRSAAESIGFNKYGSSYVMDNEFLFLGSLLVNNEKCDVITFLLNKEFLFYVDSSASSAGNAGLVGGSDQNQSKIEEKLRIYPVCRISDIEKILVHRIPSIGTKSLATGQKTPDTFTIIYKQHVLSAEQKNKLDPYSQHLGHAKHNQRFVNVSGVKTRHATRLRQLHGGAHLHSQQAGSSFIKPELFYYPDPRNRLSDFDEINRERKAAYTPKMFITKEEMLNKLPVDVGYNKAHMEVQYNAYKYRTGKFGEVKQVVRTTASASSDKNGAVDHRHQKLFEYTLPASIDRVPWRAENGLGYKMDAKDDEFAQRSRFFGDDSEQGGRIKERDNY
ncbi:unnamed protein product, partial [Amoebophrya sp. A120]|eukprot:GSA120T00009044001.1